MKIAAVLRRLRPHRRRRALIHRAPGWAEQSAMLREGRRDARLIRSDPIVTVGGLAWTDFSRRNRGDAGRR